MITIAGARQVYLRALEQREVPEWARLVSEAVSEIASAQLGIEPPEIEFEEKTAAAGRGEPLHTIGATFRDKPGWIHIRLYHGQSLEQLIRTAAHEVRHRWHYQTRFAGDAEADADRFAESFIRQYKPAVLLWVEGRIRNPETYNHLIKAP